MCKKCKGCGKSNLGAMVTHIEKIAVRILDGEVVEQFQDSFEESQTTEINYCFECAKPITEEDLFEDVQCPICGKMVGGLTESGACQECTDEANKLASMSKEQLILMLMKQAHGGTVSASEAPVTGAVIAAQEGAEPVKDTAPEKKEEEVKVDTQYIEDSMKANKEKENSDSDDADTTTVKKTRNRKKVEPAEITTEGVNEAKEEIIEKLEDVEVVGTVDPGTIIDSENTAALTTIDDGNVAPTLNPNDDVDAILKELDGVNLESGGEIF